MGFSTLPSCISYLCLPFSKRRTLAPKNISKLLYTIKSKPSTVSSRGLYFPQAEGVWCGVQSSSHVRLFVTPQAAAHQALWPWDSPGKNTGVDCHSLLQRIFLTHGRNPGLLHFRQILYRLRHRVYFPPCYVVISLIGNSAGFICFCLHSVCFSLIFWFSLTF